MSRALAGLRVLDVTQVMAGPFCAMMLADMGADVIKVEPPAGDVTRRWKGAQGTESPPYNAVNRGKRGMVLNLKHADGRRIFRDLALKADVLIENYRPGVMKEFGLDYDTLAREHPGLVYCSVSGYGQTGPYAQKGGFDLVAQGMSGLMSVTGEPGGAPVKCGVPITDLGAGLFALSGILAALYHRSATGQGQHVDTSLLEAGIALSVWEATEYFTDGEVPGPLGSAHRMNAPYQAIRCADGHITLGAANEQTFRLFCQVCGHPEWTTLPDFATAALRVQNRAALIALIEGVTARLTRADLLTQMDAAGVPGGPILNYAEVFADPHVRARAMVQEVEHPTLGSLRTLGSPLKLSATPVQAGQPAPLLGQHTESILGEIGLDPGAVQQLKAAGVIG
ncbi:MAG: Formyl-CoA transferase [Firmicutes bacterium]|nr:Formyl-CoA transferase [Bacillota bacterium]